MNNEVFSPEGMRYSQKAELVRRIKSIGLPADKERLALLVAMNELPFAEIDFHEGGEFALRAVRTLDESGLYVVILDDEKTSKIIITNNEKDFDAFSKEGIKHQYDDD